MKTEEVGHGSHNPHVLLLPYPSQGHINPMHQFAKRLVSKGLKATLVVTNFISKTHQPHSNSSHGVGIETISDGYDDNGFCGARNIEAYLKDIEITGGRSLAELIQKLSNSGHRIDCLVYDAFLPWALDVARSFSYGIVTASFFTQACAVNNIYYQVHQGLIRFPSTPEPSNVSINIPGVPVPFEAQDLPSFFYVPSQYPAYLELVLNQFCNVEKADWVFINTFLELEVEEIGWMKKQLDLARAIGPTIPSIYLDKRLEDDKDYDLNLYNLDKNICINWLNKKKDGSVIYVSFGSMADLGTEQMQELANGLVKITSYSTNYSFLWVVRKSEQHKLPSNLLQENSYKGTEIHNLIIDWSPQLQVLGHRAIGCFVTHCGWNSTLEALSLGVRMVGIPQWTDQPTNAKLVEDVWKVGLRAKVDEKRITRVEEIEKCVMEVMEGDKGKEMKKEAEKWRNLAKEAVDEGGSSDRSINEFIGQLMVINK